jgi:metal-responsive CopG/Arc/MetJ family transcriptional regulator
MQTIEITLDEAIIAQIDRVTHERALTRAAFIQQSLEAALREQEMLEQERRHAEGYAKYPATPDDFSGWEKIRVWEEP